ncbi:MAG: hypothetical protein KAR42_11235 [candidate division Zixibacteria bacterium]|nr:hypothetical protein [candidate division Zixibacteria bacterium]
MNKLRNILLKMPALDYCLTLLSSMVVDVVTLRLFGMGNHWSFIIGLLLMYPTHVILSRIEYGSWKWY